MAGFRELDWAAASKVMRAPVILDGRRLLDGTQMRDLGFTYAAVGTGDLDGIAGPTDRQARSR